MRRAVCEPISLPEEITCHMGLHSFTCRPTEVTFLTLPCLEFVIAAHLGDWLPDMKSGSIRQPSPLPQLARSLCKPGPQSQFKVHTGSTDRTNMGKHLVQGCYADSADRESNHRPFDQQPDALPLRHHAPSREHFSADNK